ncbi:hypothetical protein [Crateriforma conspicua]|uniref:NHL repeat protein n=1 Tax=Crateriforma conspicua TaxID=2527996 RepID=A0A5C6FV28_9PLAN|nr:hypothetical protein [Crateriforma conspicua]TWU65435.1 hypothetical protein V7x_09820 [Crateriforma conspicua]
MNRMHAIPIVVATIAIVGAAGYLVVDRRVNPDVPGSAFQLDLNPHLRPSAEAFEWKQVRKISLALQDPIAIEVSSADFILVLGRRPDQQGDVVWMDQAGNVHGAMELSFVPQCATIDSAASGEVPSILVASANQVHRVDFASRQVTPWASMSADANITAIAMSDTGVYLADAGQRLVHHFDHSAGLMNQWDGSDRVPDGRRFNVPSNHFELLCSGDGLLYVVNPGLHRVETYSSDGKFELAWGESGVDVESFFGCCNPVHLSRLPDGRFLTSEKGIPRIKVYTADGQFDGLVAASQDLQVDSSRLGDPRTDMTPAIFDVASNSAGEILVLDPLQHCVRVFAQERVADQRELAGN